jgi:2-polyprenyl-3-methyl-5-hydroxy-6-metoxy-1,4-benzoquinol methylase
MTRDLDLEHSDSSERLYAYRFDYLMHDWFLDRVRAYLNPNSTCLELGCFEGKFTHQLSNIFHSVHAVEGSLSLYNKLLSLFDSNYNVELYHSLFELFTSSHKYGNIFLMHTLEHINDPQQVLEKCRQWISDDGYVLILVPNANAISRQIAVNAGLIHYNTVVTEAEHQHGHRRTYTLDTLTHEVTKAGFKVADRGGIFFKALANYQLDRCIQTNIIDDRYISGCLELGRLYPDFCSSIFVVCQLNHV